MDKGYLAGFIEGEGCFMVHKNGKCYAPTFAISLRDDDACILEDMKKTLQVDARVLPKLRRDKSKPQVTMHMSSVNNCLKLIKFLDGNPFIGKKREQYEIWKQAVYYHQRNQHHGGELLEARNRKKNYLKECHDILMKLKRYKKLDVFTSIKQLCL